MITSQKSESWVSCGALFVEFERRSMMSVDSTPIASGTDARPALTRELARFASTVSYDSMPQEVVQWLKYDALDSMAVGLFGSSLSWIRLATELWEEFGGAPQATVWGRRSKLPVPIAV